ncbi:hypothetical protein ACTQ1A_07815, partial [Pseudoscardovia suis]
AVSVPIYLNQRKSAWNSNAEQDVKNAQVQVETAMTANGGNLKSIAAATCDGDKNDGKVTFGDQTITCSPGVTVTVTPATDGLTYTITGSHANGTKQYTYDSASNSSVQVAPKSTASSTH